AHPQHLPPARLARAALLAAAPVRLLEAVRDAQARAARLDAAARAGRVRRGARDRRRAVAGLARGRARAGAARAAVCGVRRLRLARYRAPRRRIDAAARTGGDRHLSLRLRAREPARAVRPVVARPARRGFREADAVSGMREHEDEVRAVA